MIKRLNTPILFFILLFSNLFLIALQTKTSSGENVVKYIFFKLTSPLVSEASLIKNYIIGLSENFKDRKTLIEENKKLKREIFKLRVNKLICSRIKLKNAILKKMLNLESLYDFNGFICEVISKKFDVFSSSITIYCPKIKGLKEELPVISYNGLVGYIIHKNGFCGEVELITNSGVALSVINERKGIKGIAYGTGKNLLNVNYIPQSEKVEKNDIFITSGDDKMYPKGIPVGIVVSVKKGEGIFQKVDIIPLVNFSNLEYVYILSKNEESTLNEKN